VGAGATDKEQENDASEVLHRPLQRRKVEVLWTVVGHPAAAMLTAHVSHTGNPLLLAGSAEQPPATSL